MKWYFQGTKFRQLAIYLFKWQLGTLIIVPCLKWLRFGLTVNTVLGNIIGGLIFFPIDIFIIRGKEEHR